MVFQNKKYLLELVAPVGVSGLPGTTCLPILASCAGIGRSRLGNALKPFAGADALKGETAECIVHLPCCFISHSNNCPIFRGVRSSYRLSVCWIRTCFYLNLMQLNYDPNISVMYLIYNCWAGYANKDDPDSALRTMM